MAGLGVLSRARQGRPGPEQEQGLFPEPRSGEQSSSEIAEESPRKKRRVVALAPPRGSLSQDPHPEVSSSVCAALHPEIVGEPQAAWVCEPSSRPVLPCWLVHLRLV